MSVTDADRPLRLGILVSHPIQYFAPLFRHLSREPGITLTVIYRTRAGIDAYHDPGFGQSVKWDIPLLDGYRSHFLSNKTTLTGFEPAVAKALLTLKLDVLIVHGYSSSTNLLAMATARLIGTRILIRGDTRLQTRHLATSRARRLIKQIILRSAHGLLAIGTLNEQYYLALGAPADRVYFVPLSVDNGAFATDPERRLLLRHRHRQTLEIPERAVIVLYAAKLTDQKRPQDLLRAFARIKAQYPEAWLLFAGSGGMDAPLRAEATARGIERVRFVGFQNQSVLPGLLAACDLFVLPARDEAWGLSVNEAMAAGLPVIVSDDVGAAADLVRNKGTGIIYQCGDIDALGEALGLLLQSEEKRIAMGSMGRTVIAGWDIGASSGALAGVARSVAGGRQQISLSVSNARVRVPHADSGEQERTGQRYTGQGS